MNENNTPQQPDDQPTTPLPETRGGQTPSDAPVPDASVPGAPVPPRGDGAQPAGGGTGDGGSGGGTPSDASRTTRNRGILIGAAAVAILVLVGGGAYALGAGGRDDAEPAGHSRTHSDDSERDSQRGSSDSTNSGDDDDASETPSSSGEAPAENLAASDAKSLVAAAEKAISKTSAEGATSIDAEVGGYEVEVRLPDGGEADVFVTTDGAVSQDPDQDRDADDAAEPLLDLGKIAAISKAALAASEDAGGAGGVIDSISSSDDRGVAYEVSIQLGDGRDADVDLSSALKTVTTDIDDD